MAKWEKFQETFYGNVLNAGQFPSTFGSVSVSGGLLTLTVASGAGNYNGADTGTYDLTNSYIYAEMVASGNQALVTYEAYPVQLILDANNSITWLLNQGTFVARKKVAGATNTIGSGLTYNAAIHKLFRIREESGVVYWDWSTDGITWTNYVSELVSNLFAITALKLECVAGTFGTEGSGTAMTIRNINVPVGTAGKPAQVGPRVKAGGNNTGGRIT